MSGNELLKRSLLPSGDGGKSPGRKKGISWKKAAVIGAGAYVGYKVQSVFLIKTIPKKYQLFLTVIFKSLKKNYYCIQTKSKI